MLNQVTIKGYAQEDAKSIIVGSTVKTVFTLVHIEKRKEAKDRFHFVDVECWGYVSDVAGQYVGKGKNVIVSGRLQFQSWEDKTSGKKRSKLVVVAEELELLGAKRFPEHK